MPYGAIATGSDSSPKVSVPPRRGVGVANDLFEAAVAPPASDPAAIAPAPTAPALASRSRRLSPFPSWVSGVSSAMCCPSFSISDQPSAGRRPAASSTTTYSRPRSLRSLPQSIETERRLDQETFQESIVGSSIDRALSRGRAGPIPSLSRRISARLASTARRSESGCRATGWGCTWKIRSGTA